MFRESEESREWENSLHHYRVILLGIEWSQAGWCLPSQTPCQVRFKIAVQTQLGQCNVQKCQALALAVVMTDHDICVF